jgi:aryl-alcohol dehydrogenase-like predicted oxidoreductase
MSSIPRRRVGDGALEFSLLGVTVLPPTVSSPGADRGVIERLRQVRAAGVTTFDVAGSGQPAQSERLLRLAFPSFDPAIVVIIGRQLADLADGERRQRGSDGHGDTALSVLRRSISDSARRLDPNRIGVLEWMDDDLSPDLEGDVSLSDDEGTHHLLLARRLGERRSTLPSPRSSSSSPLLVSGPLSLLDPSWIGPLGGRAPGAPISLLARDPFAGGLLDGTRARAAGLERGPGAGPLRLRDLQAEFAPVLRLEFLTADRRRTMAQAAVQFAAGWPWVTSVLVPLPTSDRMDELLSAFDRPPLSAEDLRRVALVQGSPRADRHTTATPGSNMGRSS